MGPASVDRYPSGSACRLRRLPRGAVGAAPGGAPPSRDRCTSAGAMKPFTSAQFIGFDTPERVDVSPHSVHKTANPVRRRPLPPNHIHAGQPGFPVISKITQSRRGRSASTCELSHTNQTLRWNFTTIEGQGQCSKLSQPRGGFRRNMAVVSGAGGL